MRLFDDLENPGSDTCLDGYVLSYVDEDGDVRTAFFNDTDELEDFVQENGLEDVEVFPANHDKDDDLAEMLG